MSIFSPYIRGRVVKEVVLFSGLYGITEQNNFLVWNGLFWQNILIFRAPSPTKKSTFDFLFMTSFMSVSKNLIFVESMIKNRQRRVKNLKDFKSLSECKIFVAFLKQKENYKLSRFRLRCSIILKEYEQITHIKQMKCQFR